MDYWSILEFHFMKLKQDRCDHQVPWPRRNLVLFFLCFVIRSVSFISMIFNSVAFYYLSFTFYSLRKRISDVAAYFKVTLVSAFYMYILNWMYTHTYTQNLGVFSDKWGHFRRLLKWKWTECPQMFFLTNRVTTLFKWGMENSSLKLFIFFFW